MEYAHFFMYIFIFIGKSCRDIVCQSKQRFSSRIIRFKEFAFESNEKNGTTKKPFRTDVDGRSRTPDIDSSGAVTPIHSRAHIKFETMCVKCFFSIEIFLLILKCK